MQSLRMPDGLWMGERGAGSGERTIYLEPLHSADGGSRCGSTRKGHAETRRSLWFEFFSASSAAPREPVLTHDAADNCDTSYLTSP